MEINRRVTLAMPVYNGARFLGEAIESILNQTYVDFRLIVTDNASTDETRAIVEGFAARDARISYFNNGKNLGAAQNYNRGYELSDSEYLKWCADDDILGDTVLEECVKALDGDSTLSVAYPATQIIDENSKVTSQIANETPSILSCDPAARFAEALDRGGTCFPIFGLIRKSCLDRSMLHLPYYGSDRALLAELALLGKFRRIETATFFNREHPTRSINIMDKLERSRWQGGKARRSASAESIHLYRHLFRIAHRHRDLVAPGALRKLVLSRCFSRRELQRFGLELTSFASPRVAYMLKSLFVA